MHLLYFTYSLNIITGVLVCLTTTLSFSHFLIVSLSQVFEICPLSVIAANFADYRNSFLYALCTLLYALCPMLYAQSPEQKHSGYFVNPGPSLFLPFRNCPSHDKPIRFPYSCCNAKPSRRTNISFHCFKYLCVSIRGFNPYLRGIILIRSLI